MAGVVVGLATQRYRAIPLVAAVVWITQKRLRLRMRDMRPQTAVASLAGVPALAIAGDHDLLAPPADVQAVAKVLNADLLVVSGAGHNDMCETGGDAYRQRILDFLAR